MLLELIADFWLELSAMLALMLGSGFFSCSEAAFFSLSRNQRAEMGQGTSAERYAVALLSHPERLLTSILFWNLLINMTYFALASIITMRLQKSEMGEGWIPQGFAIGALLVMILTSELLPKNLGVLNPRRLSTLVALPLTAATNLVGKILPMLIQIGNATARLIVPNSKPEAALALEDLERAVELGSGETHDDKILLFQERQILQRVVDLASAKVAEIMRPRRRCTVISPPGTVSDLGDGVEGEYLLFTENDSDEISLAMPVSQLAMASTKQLVRQAEPVVYVPWCATASETLGQLRKEGRRVAAVLNELGETIGVVTLERLLDSVLRDSAAEDPIDPHAVRIRLTKGAWEATGTTPLRKIAKRINRPLTAKESARDPIKTSLDLALDSMRSVTVSGLMLEMLERPPCLGDRIELGGWVWTVIEGVDEVLEPGRDDMPIVVRIIPDLDFPSNQGRSK